MAAAPEARATGLILREGMERAARAGLSLWATGANGMLRLENSWWLVRFLGIPETLTEGETQEDARAHAVDCVVAALGGYMKTGKPLPRHGATHTGRNRTVLPSLVTAKLAVYETMRARGWSRLKLARDGEFSAPTARSPPQLASLDYRRGAGKDARGTVHRSAEGGSTAAGGVAAFLTSARTASRYRRA